MGTVGILAFFSGTFVADREEPFVRSSGTISPSNPRPGQRVEVHWDAELKRVCPGKIFRRWQDADGDIFELPSSLARYHQRGRMETMSAVVIPRNATCGKNTYTSIGEYECNWTHRFWPIRTSASIDVEVSCEGPVDLSDQIVPYSPAKRPPRMLSSR